MLTVAVIGCGYWGPNLVRNFNALSGCRVKYVCDTDKKRLTYIKDLFPEIETTTSFSRVIGDDEVDAVAIVTPVNLHYDLAKKFLLAKKNTFVEKPMAASVKECRELIDLAGKNQLTLMVGHTFVYTACVRKIREIITDGDIGDILYINSRRLNLGLFQKDINVAWDLAPHDLSIILYIMQDQPVSVNCQGKCHVHAGIEDVTSMTLDFANGSFAVILNSWLDPNKIREMVIVGSKRMIVYDDTQPLEKVKIYDKRVETPPHYDTFAEFQYSYHYGDMYSPYIKHEEPLKLEAQHFLDCIKTGETPESSGRDGLHVVQILEASSRSLNNGGARVEIAELG